MCEKTLYVCTQYEWTLSLSVSSFLSSSTIHSHLVSRWLRTRKNTNSEIKIQIHLERLPRLFLHTTYLHTSTVAGQSGPALASSFPSAPPLTSPRILHEQARSPSSRPLHHSYPAISPSIHPLPTSLPQHHDSVFNSSSPLVACFTACADSHIVLITTTW